MLVDHRPVAAIKVEYGGCLQSFQVGDRISKPVAILAQKFKS
jgi:hypothetical protein